MKIMHTLLIVLLIVLSLGALAGGGTFILNPGSDNALNMPLSSLSTSPFSNFFIPGLILFIFIGILPLIAVYLIMSRKEISFFNKLKLFPEQSLGWNLALYQGFILFVWITIQMIWIAYSYLHTVYAFYAVFIFLLTLLPSVRQANKV